MTKRAAVLLFLALASPAQAGEPILGSDQPMSPSGWHWHIDGDQPSALHLFKPGAKQAHASYDLGNCQFCSGEEDNCDKDGIVEVTVRDPGDEPILAVICHVGAHSQQLEIFAPRRDTGAPVYSLTGDYYVDYEPRKNGLSITYDRRNDAGGFDQIKDHWPKE